MPSKESPFFSYFQFIITGYFGFDTPIECSQRMLKEYFEEMENLTIPTYAPLISNYPILSFIQKPELPFIYCAIAFPLTILILFLNRKKYVESYGILCFTNFYYTILAIYCFLKISYKIYELIWNLIFLNNAFCTLIVTEWSDYGSPKHSKIYLPPWKRDTDITYPRMFQWLSEIANLYEKWIKHIFTWFLILHRITTYWACSRREQAREQAQFFF